MEIVGSYQYNTKDLIGHGAFAVVFKGCQIEVLLAILRRNSSIERNLTLNN